MNLTQFHELACAEIENISVKKKPTKENVSVHVMISQGDCYCNCSIFVYEKRKSIASSSANPQAAIEMLRLEIQKFNIEQNAKPQEVDLPLM